MKSLVVGWGNLARHVLFLGFVFVHFRISPFERMIYYPTRVGHLLEGGEFNNRKFYIAC
jgi:hypothetical protein